MTVRAASGVAETPDRDLDRTIAHLLSTVEHNTGHLEVHTAAARAAKDPGLLAHHLKHSGNHVAAVSSHLVKLRAAVTRRLPAVAAQLDDLDRAIPGHRAVAEDVPRAALDMSVAHDLASAQTAAAHIARHLYEAQAAQKAGNRVSVRFNLDHAVHHVAEVTHHVSELDTDLTRRLPPARAELGLLAGAENPPPGDPAPADYDVPGGGPQPA